MPAIVVELLGEMTQVRVERDHGVLGTEIRRVVETPVDLANLAGWVEETGEDVGHHDTRAETNAHGLAEEGNKSQWRVTG